MKKDKKLTTVIEKAIQKINNGNWDSALSILQKHCKKTPQNASTPLNIGLFFQSNNMPIKAEIFYSQSLEITPDQPVILFNLGVIYQSLNRLNDAIKAYTHAIDLDPNYAKCYANLGYVYNEINDQKNSQKYCKQALKLSPNDPQIGHMLASLNVTATPDTADENYIKNVFDNYADNYDQHLVDGLKFKIPKLIFDAISQHLPSKKTLDIIDLGCGTGLSGELFSATANTLVGVDLSEGMIQKAKEKAIYTKLHIGEIDAVIKDYTLEFDLAICSDVLIYIGKLDVLFRHIQASLNKKGQFCFSIEALSDSKSDYTLGSTGRYKHNQDYISKVAISAGFEIISNEEASLRKQDNQDVLGRIYILKKI